ncbi:cyclophilin-like domain-containing protein [Trichophaea hybrida]|nr:cyclophilin-like domain-containing protein [Trichophaea hybrida]
MAQLYALEPQTNAKVLFKTNYGDLELELWGQQTPLTTRNFLQLCYDGYYNGTAFHRLVPGFILQGGDPTGTGHGGEAIYPGGLFADEFHSRLKYNRRGLVGMANSGRKDDNGSQFFLTLGDTKELNGKNTLFGKIVGDTIYNLVRMGELELEEGAERPMFPPKVLATEVLVNPFEDVKPRETKRKAEELEKPGKKAAVAAGKKKKGGKALLSFIGGDEEEEDGITAPIKKKPKFDTRLVVDAPVTTEERAPAKLEVKSPTKQEEKAPEKREENPPTKPGSKPRKKPTPSRTSPSPPPSRTPTPPPTASSILLSQTNAQITALKRSLRRSASPPPAPPPKKKSLLTLQKSLLPATSIQGRKRLRNQTSDDASFLALEKFREKLASAPSPPPPSLPAPPKSPTEEAEKEEGGGDTEAILCDLHFIPNCQSCSNWERAEEEEAEGEGGEVDMGFWGHALSFEKDRLGKDLTWKKKNEELVVIDPREKQKEILGKRKGKGDGGERRENNRRREMRGR